MTPIQGQMGVVRPREFDVDQPSHTEQLANWINRIRTKKISCKRNRKRNLRVEAVLTSVLSKAELELRNKQMSRIVRWQQMRQRMYEIQRFKDGGHLGKDFQNGDSYEFNLEKVVPELSSFNTFMAELNEIKAPLQR